MTFRHAASMVTEFIGVPPVAQFRVTAFQAPRRSGSYKLRVGPARCRFLVTNDQ